MASQHNQAGIDLELKAYIAWFVGQGRGNGGRLRQPGLELVFSGKDLRKAVVGFVLLASGKAA
jgi:hypothetical protein